MQVELQELIIQDHLCPLIQKDVTLSRVHDIEPTGRAGVHGGANLQGHPGHEIFAS